MRSGTTMSSGTVRHDRQTMAAQERMQDQRMVQGLKRAFESFDFTESGVLPMHTLSRCLGSAQVSLKPGVLEQIVSRFSKRCQYQWRDVVRYLLATPGSLDYAASPASQAPALGMKASKSQAALKTALSPHLHGFL